jgi:hypothetical protein
MLIAGLELQETAVNCHFFNRAKFGSSDDTGFLLPVIWIPSISTSPKIPESSIVLPSAEMATPVVVAL